MSNATYTLAARNNIKEQFMPIDGLPLMSRAQAEKALELATRKGEFFQLAIVNTQSI